MNFSLPTKREPAAFLLLIITYVWLGTAYGKSESDYAAEWAAAYGGNTEVRMPDGTRCDVLTDSHAIEVEFASKWAEAVGQSLFYALQTGKRAGIVLILHNSDERRYWIRLNSVVLENHLAIDVWTVGRGRLPDDD